MIAARVVEPGVISPELIDVVANLQGGAGPDGMTVDADGNLYVAECNTGQVIVVNAAGSVLGTIDFPAEAGPGTTNVALHGGYLCVTEASKNEVWRFRTKVGAVR